MRSSQIISSVAVFHSHMPIAAASVARERRVLSSAEHVLCDRFGSQPDVFDDCGQTLEIAVAFYHIIGGPKFERLARNFFVAVPNNENDGQIKSSNLAKLL